MTATFNPDEEMKIYHNAEEVGSLDVSNYNFNDSSGTDPMKIGVLSYADTQYYDGKIDELRLYNRELSANEVKQLYQWAPGPMMHLKMDEKVAGDAQTLYDISGNEVT